MNGYFGPSTITAINNAMDAVKHHNQLYWHYDNFTDSTLYHYARYPYDDAEDIVCNKRYIRFCRHVPIIGKKLERHYINHHTNSSYFHIDYLSMDCTYRYISKLYSDEEILFYMYRRSSIEDIDLYEISHELGMLPCDVDEMLWKVVYKDNKKNKKPAPAPTRKTAGIG